MTITEPFGVTTWRTCREAHAQRVTRMLTWAHRRSMFLKVGILGTLAVFLPAALLASTGRLGPARYDDAVAFFRLGIALTVLPLGWLSAGPGPLPGSEPLRAPFPVHIQALIGTRVVLWLFRLVGLVWLAQAGLHVAHRAGLA